jgi:hypothetical protein
MAAKYNIIFLILLIEIEYELVTSPSKNSIMLWIPYKCGNFVNRLLASQYEILFHGIG